MAEPYMTLAEIEARFPNEWVVIDNPKLNRYHQILGGYVVLHCADRAEFLRMFGQMEDTGSKLAAVRYIGRFPDECEESISTQSEPGAA